MTSIRSLNTRIILLVAASLGLGAAAEVGLASPTGAEKVEAVLAELQNFYVEGDTQPRTYELTEADLNDYFRERVSAQNERAVESLSVGVRAGGFGATVTVDLDRVESKEEHLPGILAALLSGKQRLLIGGTLSAQDGVGEYQLEQIQLNGVEYPPLVVQSLVGLLGQKAGLSVDPGEPFPMPYGIKTLTLMPGLVTIRTHSP